MMFIKPAIQALLALSMAGASVADQADENAPTSGPLPISYGKCYKIQTEQRTWMAKNKADGYQRWDRLLNDADTYKICQRNVYGSCEYDSVRSVQGGEDYFIWSFKGSNGGEPNLLAAYNWFFPAYSSWRENYIFHFQGEAECDHNTNPCAIRTGGYNNANANGIQDKPDYPRRATDGSTVLLWYQEVDCPE